MPLPYEARYTIKDRKDKISLMTVYFEYFNDAQAQENTIDEVMQAVILIGQLIDPMISGAIINASLCLNMSIPSVKTTPTTTADVEEKAVFVFSNAFGKPRITIPTFRDSLIVDGSDVVDTSDSDVSAFIFGVTDGSGSILETVLVCDNRDDEISGFVEAYERFRKS